jgi:predicted ester cyclase
MEATMTRELVRDLARRLFDGFTRQELGVFDELCTGDLVIDTPEVTIERGKEDGLRASKDLMTKLYSFLPDGVFTIEDLIAEEAKVAVRYSFVGTFVDRATGKSGGQRHANAQCFLKLTGDKISYMRFVGWPEFGGWLHIH